MILYFMAVITMAILAAMLKTKPWEGFATKSQSKKAPPADIVKQIDYVSCIALNRPKDESDTRMTTTRNVGEAPFWSSYVTATTLQDALSIVISRLKSLGESNKGILQGPGYLLVGRNPEKRNVNVWVYLPSIGKDDKPAPDDMLYMYHGWLRNLLFSSLYAVTDWLCNNACDEDLVPLKYKKNGEYLSGTMKKDETEEPPKNTTNRKTTGRNTGSTIGLSFRYIPESDPECGCVSSRACPFGNLPWKFSANPRNMNEISTYSVYKMSIPFFSRANITLQEPYNLLADKAPSGTEMYQGCDVRLLSNNRLHAVEIDKTGIAFYNTIPSAPFRDNCLLKPDEKYVDTNKVLKERIDITGTMPRLVLNDEEIALQAILKNPDKNQKEWVSQWRIPKGMDDPYTLKLENNGKLVMVDKNGIKSDAVFEKIK